MTDPLANPPTAAEFHEIARCIGDQTTSIEHLSTRLKISEKRAAIMVIALVALAALVAFVGVLFFLVFSSIHEQCSLYELIIPSYSDVAKQRSPLGPAAYDDAFRRIQISADNLWCGIPHKVPGT